MHTLVETLFWNFGNTIGQFAVLMLLFPVLFCYISKRTETEIYSITSVRKGRGHIYTEMGRPRLVEHRIKRGGSCFSPAKARDIVYYLETPMRFAVHLIWFTYFHSVI